MQRLKSRKIQACSDQNALCEGLDAGTVGVSLCQCGSAGRTRGSSRCSRPSGGTASSPPRNTAKKQHEKKKKKRKRGTPVFYAILVAAHLYFSRCASERERSERERCASSRVPLAISRFFAIFRDFRDFSRLFVIFAIFSRFFARARASLAHRVKYRCAATKIAKKYRCGATKIAKIQVFSD